MLLLKSTLRQGGEILCKTQTIPISALTEPWISCVIFIFAQPQKQRYMKVTWGIPGSVSVGLTPLQWLYMDPEYRAMFLGLISYFTIARQCKIWNSSQFGVCWIQWVFCRFHYTVMPIGSTQIFWKSASSKLWFTIFHIPLMRHLIIHELDIHFWRFLPWITD